MRRIVTLMTALAMVLLTIVSAGARPPGDNGDGPYEFGPAVFDIAAASDGSILVGENFSVKEIRGGVVSDVREIGSDTPINGLAAFGRANAFVATAGTDLAVDGALWRVSRGSARMVADLAAFERNNDPDAFEGPMWKDQRCEAIDGFTAGPQNNPYHVAALSGSTALIADAAGNTLLSARVNGSIDWVAIFTPPVDQSGDWLIRWETDGIDCYVQPVPTSVAIGPDGAYYVGELTGATAEGLPIGLSRVWRIEPGARNVVCPSADCSLFLDGLTSVIDVEFGPDGRLYVVEYDANSWLAAVVPAIPLGGGSIHACDIATGVCTEVPGEFNLPSAITFDQWGSLWLLEGNITSPTVRRVDY
jgi:hypothetical protein